MLGLNARFLTEIHYTQTCEAGQSVCAAEYIGQILQLSIGTQNPNPYTCYVTST